MCCVFQPSFKCCTHESLFLGFLKEVLFYFLHINFRNFSNFQFLLSLLRLSFSYHYTLLRWSHSVWIFTHAVTGTIMQQYQSLKTCLDKSRLDVYYFIAPLYNLHTPKSWSKYFFLLLSNHFLSIFI